MLKNTKIILFLLIFINFSFFGFSEYIEPSKSFKSSNFLNSFSVSSNLQNYLLEVNDSRYISEIVKVIEDNSGEVFLVSERRVRFSFSSSNIKVISSIEYLNFVERFSFPEVQNFKAKGFANVNYYFENFGLYGFGQIVGVADSGLDTGNLNTIHNDFKNKR